MSFTAISVHINEILYFTDTSDTTLYALGKEGKYLWVCDPGVDAFWSSDVSLEEDRIVVHFGESDEEHNYAALDLAYSYDGEYLGIVDGDSAEE